MEQFSPDRAAFETELSGLVRAESPQIIVPSVTPARLRGCRRIALFPASFNPPTRAHWEMGLRSQRDHDLILFILDLRNADKRNYDVPLWYRYQMLQSMVEHKTIFVAAISSHGLIIEHLDAATAFFPAVETFSVIVGSDTMVRILSPAYYKNPERAFHKLLTQSRFHVFLRDDAHRDQLMTMLSATSMPECAGKAITVLDFERDLQRISSTLVRQTFAAGGPIDHLVCPSVQHSIGTWQLYR